MLPNQVRELAELPLTVVEDAIRDSQARAHVRDQAAWVVTLLRQHRDHAWKIRPPAPPHDSPEALAEAFRRHAAEQEAEREQLRLKLASLEAEEVDDPCPPANAPPEPAPAPAALTFLEAVWMETLEYLRIRLPRSARGSWLRETRLVALQDGMAVVAVPNLVAKGILEHEVIYALGDVFDNLGLELKRVRVILAASLEANRHAAPDDPTIPPPHDSTP